MKFYNGWFNDFYCNYSEERKPDLILFDLGISVFHYEKSGRGFSFRHDEELDMRLNANTKESATDIVNEMPEDELANMIYLYSDEKYSRRIASAIVSVCIRWTGLLVINSMLVLPAASARFVSRTSRRYLIVSELISLAGGIAGLCFSYYTGSASGASIVLVNSAFFLICFIISFLKKNS